MKVNAQFKSKIIDDKHNAHINLLITNYRHVKWLDELEQDELYNVTITKVKSKRSIQSNNYLWSLIRELALVTREDDLDLYTKLLDSANAKFTYIVTVDGAEDTLKKSFRVVKKIEKRNIVDMETDKITEGYMYKCYFGSSKFSTKEMSVLIDTLITWCEAENIRVEDYR